MALAAAAARVGADRRRGAGRVAVASGLAGVAVLVGFGIRTLGPGASGAPPRSDGSLIVLCVGDSITAGEGAPAEGAYPEQLERQLVARGVTARVYNRGVDGQCTRQVRSALEHDLDVYRPDLVLILSGVNDAWNRAQREDLPARPSRLVEWLRARGTTAPAAPGTRPPMELVESSPRRHLWHIEVGGVTQVVDVAAADPPLDATTVRRLTSEDLAAIVAAVRARAVRPMLLTYPTDFVSFEAANDTIRAVAAATGTPLFESGGVTRRLERRGVPALFRPDMHPTARYYGELARAIAAWLTDRP